MMTRRYRYDGSMFRHPGIISMRQPTPHAVGATLSGPGPSHMDNLAEVLADACRLFARGVAGRRSAFRTSTVATVGSDNLPRVRTMVLRRADKASRQFTPHSDLRAGKLAGIAPVPRTRTSRRRPRLRRPRGASGAPFHPDTGPCRRRVGTGRLGRQSGAVPRVLCDRPGAGNRGDRATASPDWLGGGFQQFRRPRAEFRLVGVVLASSQRPPPRPLHMGDGRIAPRHTACSMTPGPIGGSPRRVPGSY